MTDNQIVALCADTTFQAQVHAAAVSYAETAQSAAATSHASADTKKWALAEAVLADGGVATLNRFVWAIASLPGFSAVLNDSTDANDAAIASAIINVWPTVAGVTAADN